MVTIARPAKNNIYSLMMGVTTLVFLIGLIAILIYRADYNALPEPAKVGSVRLPEVGATVAAPAEEPAVKVDGNNFDFDAFDTNDLGGDL